MTVGNMVRGAGGVLASPMMSMAGWGLMAALSVGSWRNRVQEGQNPITAAIKEGGMFALGSMLSGPAAFTLFVGAPLARVGTTALLGAVNGQSHYVRSMRTPFSHRFEHSDATMRTQMLGMQALNGAWAHRHMGSEAAVMARRYAR